MKATLKRGLYLLSFSALVSLMASCLGNGTPESIYPVTDAELLTFSLTSDSVSELANVVFSIDQQHGGTGLVYNYDSMAYKTNLKDKAIVTYTSGSSTNNVLNITNGDSTLVNSGDTIDISHPLTLKLYALNGTTTKLYKVQVNIHQVDPDSMQYNLMATDLPFLQATDTKTVVFNNQFLAYSKINNQIQLYSSSDAVNWTDGGMSGLPVNTVIKGIQSNGSQLFAYTEDGELYVRNAPMIDQWILANKPAEIKIISILGYLNSGANQQEGLCLVVETGGINTFAFTGDFIQWDYDSNTPVPDDFPVYDFSNYSYQLMYLQRVSIFGGTSLNGDLLNTVWSTQNGHYWAKLTSDNGSFPPMEGANIVFYNDEFWLINGKTSSNFNKYIYYSIDGGVTWQIKPGKTQMPKDYSLRYNASLVMDKNNKYFYIIGGKQKTAIPEVWKGFLNKMEFDH
ncbi:MAG: DUF6242 domain-containing protein [Candidatus Azobacteroides sp.]|nr:DUF6242 domain-containing protein [Candidatus Azobacteroides sp.]